MKLSPGTPHATVCMKKIRELLSSPKPTGNFWALQIKERWERNEPVTPLAREIARRALASKVIQE